MFRIELERRFPRIRVIREVVNFLRHIRKEDLEAVVQRHAIVDIFL